MSFRKKLASNTLFLFLDWVFTLIFSMLFWFIIGKTLLPSHYGIIATSIQIVMALSGISLLGYDAVIRKFIPEWLKKGKNEKITELIRYTSKIIIFSSLITVIILILFCQEISYTLNLEHKVILIISFLILVVNGTGFFGSILYGFQNMKKIFLTDFYGQIIKVILLLPLIFLGFTYFAPLIASFICFLIISLSRFEKKFFIGRRVKLNKKLIMKYSSSQLIVNILSILFNYTQYIILALLINKEKLSSEIMTRVGYFAIAMNISFPIQIIPNILLSAFFPIISGLSVDKKDKEKQSYLIKLLFRYSLFLVTPIAFFLILCSDYIIIFFSKSEYLLAAKILPLLVIASMFYGIGNIFLNNLYAIRRPKEYRNCFFGVVALYLFLSIPLTYYFFENGLAISYFISILFLLISSFLTLKRYLRLCFSLEDIGRVILATAISSIFLLFLKQFIPNIWLAIICVGIVVLIYLLILFLSGFYIEEDLKVLDFLVEKSPILKKRIISFKKFLSKNIYRSYLKTT